MSQFQSTTDFELKSVKLYPANGDKPLEIKQLVQNIEYVEAVALPYVSATIVIVDSAGLISSLPIMGSEKVIINVKTNARDEVTEYIMRIWKVGNRYTQQNKQAYTLGLVSEEVINNETVRMSAPLVGNPESIAIKLVNELGSTKTIFSESSLFEVKYLPNRERPFDIIAKLAGKAVSPQAKYTTETDSKNKNDKRGTAFNKDNKKTSGKRLKGSGGFFFWETNRGYNFFAVDSLCADKDSPLKSKKLETTAWGPYVEKVANQSDGADDRYTILTSQFSSDVDLMTGLRSGRYGTKVVMFNVSTGQYSEYDYLMSEAWENMAHLGGQDGLSSIPLSQRNLEGFPSRVMSMVIDHETWYNEPGPASPEPEDGSKKPSSYADRQKYYAAQATARFKMLTNQQAVIVIPGNAEICAGDKIDIRLVSKVPSSEQKTEPVDTESSGEYLIGEVSHSYDKQAGANGKFTTTLRLMRDSFGMKGKQSAHGSK